MHSLTTPKETRSRREIHSHTKLQEMKSLKTRRLRNESQRRRPRRPRRHAEVLTPSPTMPREMKLRTEKGFEGGERGHGEEVPGGSYYYSCTMPFVASTVQLSLTYNEVNITERKNTKIKLEFL
jgi:hypothetical protein